MRVSAYFLIFLVLSFPVAASKTYYNLDKNGNLVSGDGFFREYNGFNQLSKVYRGDNAGGELLVQYTWDPVEERVLAKEEYESGVVNQLILYVDKHQIMIKNSSGQFYETYVYQDDVLVGIVDTDGNKFAVHTDHLGSVDVITDANGEVVEKRFYSPFGEELGRYAKSRFGYEGKEKDSATGDVDFHFRKYRADMARFTQPDTLIPNVYDPQQLNRYAFERGNPLKYTDPTGHFVCGGVCVTGLTLFAIGAIAGTITESYKQYKQESFQPGSLTTEAFKGGFTAVAVATLVAYTARKGDLKGIVAAETILIGNEIYDLNDLADVASTTPTKEASKSPNIIDPENIPEIDAESLAKLKKPGPTMEVPSPVFSFEEAEWPNKIDQKSERSSGSSNWKLTRKHNYQFDRSEGKISVTSWRGKKAED